MGNGALVDTHIYLVGIFVMTVRELVKWVHENPTSTPQGFWQGVNLGERKKFQIYFRNSKFMTAQHMTPVI